MEDSYQCDLAASQYQQAIAVNRQDIGIATGQTKLAFHEVSLDFPTTPRLNQREDKRT
jgi:hypothetical protein